MDEWIREHLNKCIRAERASKILTPIDGKLYFQVQECDDIFDKPTNSFLKMRRAISTIVLKNDESYRGKLK